MDLLEIMNNEDLSVYSRVTQLLEVADVLQKNQGRALTPHGYQMAFEAIHYNNGQATPGEESLVKEMLVYLRDCKANSGEPWAQVTATSVRQKVNEILALETNNEYAHKDLEFKLSTTSFYNR